MEWVYASGVRDVPLSAFDDCETMSEFVGNYADELKTITWQPGPCNLIGQRPIQPGETRVVSCAFSSGPTLSVTVRAPAVVDPKKPAVTVFPAWGADGPSAVSFANDGYITVLVRFQDWYDALAPLYNQNGYLPIWGVIADRIMDQVNAILPAHEGEAVVSSATGSLVAPFYVLYRADVRVIVTNGVLLSLDWLRRNYRYTAWPNIWDHGLAISYTPIYLTMAHIPTQFQMGRADAFFPNIAPVPGAPSFSGYPRGQMTDEVLGQFLVLQKGWDLMGNKASMFIGPQSHLAVDHPAALAFVAEHCLNQECHL